MKCQDYIHKFCQRQLLDFDIVLKITEDVTTRSYGMKDTQDFPVLMIFQPSANL